MNDREYADLQARMIADCDRVAAEYARERERRAATKKPRKVSLKKYIELESRVTVVRKDGAQ